MEQIIVRLSEISKLYAGGDAPKEVSLVRTDEFCHPIYSNGLEEDGLYGFSKKATMRANTITVSARGTIGAAFYRREPFLPIVRLITIEPDNGKVDTWYLYYYLQMNKLEGYGTSQQQLTLPFMKKRKFLIYKNVGYQKKISTFLNNYDQLIENNNKRIKLLEDMAESLYKKWFVRFRFPGHENVEFESGIPKGWKIYKAGERYNITIGKTPPRAEQHWFTENDNAVDWSSIADMRKCIFLQRTSEQLTHDAIKKFHMVLLPKRTILVSFKLTVGLVAITSEDATTTNEAIAHFKSKDNEFEYLYMLLKNFNYKELGNTSSIGNAINSKIVKKMNLLFPNDDLMDLYHSQTKDMFDEIENLFKQNQFLIKQRDSLLPRLMSGKLSVEEKEVI